MSHHHAHDSLTEQQRHEQGLFQQQQGHLQGQNLVGLSGGQQLQGQHLHGQHIQGQATGVTVITRDIALAEEKLHFHEEQHVQPILTRDIEQKEVRQIIQPMHETIVNATQHSTGTLAQKELFIDNDRVIAPQIVPQAVRIQGQSDVNVTQHAAIVEERVHRQVIEEIQPVLYRDVIQNREVIITQPIHERIIEAPVLLQETRGMVEMSGSTYAHSNVVGNFAQGSLVQGQHIQGQVLPGQHIQGQVLPGQHIHGQVLPGQGQNFQGVGGQNFQSLPGQQHHNQGLEHGSLSERAAAKYGQDGHHHDQNQSGQSMGQKIENKIDQGLHNRNAQGQAF